jgi:hypothetical protein
MPRRLLDGVVLAAEVGSFNRCWVMGRVGAGDQNAAIFRHNGDPDPIV